MHPLNRLLHPEFSNEMGVEIGAEPAGTRGGCDEVDLLGGAPGRLQCALDRQTADLDASLAEPGAEFVRSLSGTKGGLIYIQMPLFNAAVQEKARPSRIGIRREGQKLFLREIGRASCR